MTGNSSFRLGIITMHGIPNYGSILQALATQVVMQRVGFDVEIIDYVYPGKVHAQKTLKGSILKAGNTFLKSLLPGNPHRKYVSRYREFRQRHLRETSVRYRTSRELEQRPPEYDIYLAGSDQIWRADLTKGDTSFFLTFVRKGLKASFASSFGGLEVPARYRAAVVEALEAFDLIGVRERSGQEIVRDLAGRDAAVCLDPTLMLTGREWLAYAATTSSTPKDPYVLCYGGGKSGATGGDFVEQVGLAVGSALDYRTVRLNGKFHDFFNRQVDYVLDAGPAEFIDYIAKANFVVARSFHGTIFSLLFKKDFVSVISDDPDHSSRQSDLLSRLGLSARLWVEGQSLAGVASLPPIDWAEVDDRLDRMRSETNEYVEAISSLVRLAG